ncbi:MAG: heparinase II/III domain-containing protein [Syntrophorhabdaceae bacterium]
MIRFSRASSVAANKRSTALVLDNSIPSSKTCENGSFTFLNKSKDFEVIDWNFGGHGRLWTYNLNYFDFLNQELMTADEGLRSIEDYVSRFHTLRDGLEPYPMSCRIINWIKFLSRFGYRIEEIDENLYKQARMLTRKLEYHLMGNHLLENAFALLFAACYYNDEAFYGKARKLLLSQLNEQILPDGGHFELSPMYHQLILLRLLDAINLVQSNNLWNRELLDLLREKTRLMLCWIDEITFQDGSIPLLNDSANGIAPTTSQLLEYAKRLGVVNESHKPVGKLNESGYRKVRKRKYEMVVDVGNIGPDYIPGHAHSDTFSFELHVMESPLVVDTGVSTYDTAAARQYERSTPAHNTVLVNGLNQSDVWASHRVGRRAKIVEFFESDDSIYSCHDGYKNIGVVHRRRFLFSEREIIVKDEIESSKSHRCEAFLHFHPSVQLELSENVLITDRARIIFTGAEKLIMENTYYSPEFNKRLTSKKLVAQFNKELLTEIVVLD